MTTYTLTAASAPGLLKRLASLDLSKPWVVTIERPRSRRSMSQNARLWALHMLASEATGYAPEEMHELALCRHFGSEEYEVGGVRHIRPLKRSSVRDKKDFAEFMEATETWYITEFGVWLQ